MNKNDISISIIGAGFSGIGLAIQLKKNGYKNFTIYEKAASSGGTWRDNHYPGAACDIKSHLYSFSFELNPEWTREFSDYKEINNYIANCIKKYDLSKHIVYNWEMKKATFIDNKWQITNTEEKTVETTAMVLATGALHIPKLPEIKGIESFDGKIFHSSDWDHSVDLSDKKVAVIGTGASAIQFIPNIVDKVKEMVVFQRTAPWVIPKPDKPIAAWKRALYHNLPFVMRLKRHAIYWRNELIVIGLAYYPNLMKKIGNIAIKFLKHQIKDTALQAKLTPNFVMGCKRILLANNYYPVYNRTNVFLETNGIEKIENKQLITATGKYDADVIICGTGFHVANSFEFSDIRGLDGQNLQAVWKDFPKAYLGTVVHNYPNLFLMTGPNTGLGNNSMIHIMESQFNYVISYLNELVKENAAFFHVKKETQEQYNTWLQTRLKNTIWASGCKSWYILDTERNPTVWPDFTFKYRARTRKINREDFV